MNIAQGWKLTLPKFYKSIQEIAAGKLSFGKKKVVLC